MREDLLQIFKITKKVIFDSFVTVLLWKLLAIQEIIYPPPPHKLQLEAEIICLCTLNDGCMRIARLIIPIQKKLLQQTVLKCEFTAEIYGLKNKIQNKWYN